VRVANVSRPSLVPQSVCRTTFRAVRSFANLPTTGQTLVQMGEGSAATGNRASGYDGWAVLDLDALTVVSVNPAARVALGAEAEVLPQPVGTLVADEHLALLIDTIVPMVRAGNMWSGALRLRTPGDDDAASPSHPPSGPGGPAGTADNDRATSPVVVVPQLAPGDADITHASMLIAFRPPDSADAVVDPLTGLVTRSALFSRLGSAVQRNRSNSYLLAVLFVDLDGLKNLNDRYGHEVGDTALTEVAQRIVGCLPNEALAVRFGGDEFVVIHEELSDLDDAEQLADDIVSALDRAEGYSAISASIGLAICRNGEVSPDELIRRADAAMYRAKARGGSQVAIFDAEMHNRQRAAETLRAGVLTAIAENGFGVAAQPIFELATGRILSVELFIRVRSDEPYIADTSRLHRLAHEFGETLDAAILERAVALARRWQTALADAAPRVQVNVSAQSLATTTFADRFDRAVRRADIRPALIGFEIDSRDLGSGADRERATIEDLRTVGASVVVDGFGAGDLALPTVARISPAMVKLEAGAHPADVLTGLLRSISTLGIPTCVKGLDRVDALHHAVRVGAYAGQGSALTPVRALERVNAQLHAPHRIGF